jgi:hypothetical protein
MSMPQTDCDVPVPEGAPTPAKKRGRKLGGKNREGHKAGRPRKPPEEFAESVWQNGRRRISVGDTHIAESLQRSSSACAIAAAVREQIPNAVHVSVDLATIRWTDSVKKLRYTALTNFCAQELIVNFDQGEREKLQPISFDLKPVIIARSGSRRRQVPDAGELRGSGISPASPADPPEAGASRKPKIPYAGQEKRTVSKPKPSGEVPVVLGGRMPPISALPSNQRAFGLRQAKR